MRIGIVNDLPMAVEAMRRVVLQTHEHDVAWVARDGAQAVELCLRDKPDLLLMDLVMPVMDGVEATRRIMAGSPCPIVIVTADVNGNSSKVFEAMGAGALDAVNTPVLENPGAFKGTAALLAKIDTIRRLTMEPAFATTDRACGTTVHTDEAQLEHPPTLVALGASAGGPTALAQVLAGLPADFPAPIVAVQHVDLQFAQGLVNWLDYQTPLKVRLASEGELLRPGTVFLAGTENHLVLTSQTRLGYTAHPEQCVYRPSIDVLFNSLARRWEGDVIGVLLSGMGRDGAEGLLNLRRQGHVTLTQNKLSSAVFGMPKAAIDLGAAQEVLPLSKIAARLMTLTSQHRTAHV